MKRSLLSIHSCAHRAIPDPIHQRQLRKRYPECYNIIRSKPTGLRFQNCNPMSEATECSFERRGTAESKAFDLHPSQNAAEA